MGCISSNYRWLVQYIRLTPSFSNISFVILMVKGLNKSQTFKNVIIPPFSRIRHKLHVGSMLFQSSFDRSPVWRLLLSINQTFHLEKLQKKLKLVSLTAKMKIF